MKLSSFKLKQTLIEGTAVLSLLTAPLFVNDFSGAGVVNAAEMSGKGPQGAGGGQGQKGAGGQGGQDARKGMSKVLEADDDSDRPSWAGVSGGEGRPGGGGNTDAGTVKGDEYGDLIVLLRDPLTGEPIKIDGEYQICLDVACTQTVPMVDGEVPEGVTPLEVEFGRTSLLRSPDNVTDHALAEALAKLTADGAVISQDTAGRITITVDGVTSTIDSPLENLALYIDLMKGLADSTTLSQTEAVLGDLATLDVAASLLAGGADKTGTLTVDFVVYNNVIADVVESGDFYDFSSITPTSYTREYPTDYKYFYTTDDGITVLSATLNINEYLEAINGALPSDGGVTMFTTMADDALEVVELTHTQIHTELLPGTVTQ